MENTKIHSLIKCFVVNEIKTRWNQNQIAEKIIAGLIQMK